MFQPENLMLSSCNSKCLKLIDFGLSRKLSEDVECRELLGTPEFVGQLTSMCQITCFNTLVYSSFKVFNSYFWSFNNCMNSSFLVNAFAKLRSRNWLLTNEYNKNKMNEISVGSGDYYHIMPAGNEWDHYEDWRSHTPFMMFTNLYLNLEINVFN